MQAGGGQVHAPLSRMGCPAKTGERPRAERLTRAAIFDVRRGMWKLGAGWMRICVAVTKVLAGAKADDPNPLKKSPRAVCRSRRPVGAMLGSRPVIGVAGRTARS